MSSSERIKNLEQEDVEILLVGCLIRHLVMEADSAKFTKEEVIYMIEMYYKRYQDKVTS